MAVPYTCPLIDHIIEAIRLEDIKVKPVAWRGEVLVDAVAMLNALREANIELRVDLSLCEDVDEELDEAMERIRVLEEQLAAIQTHAH
jgi:hypothetical protein